MMADNSPTLQATANLEPVSPAPVHPPSPVMVPSLQDQADAQGPPDQVSLYAPHCTVDTSIAEGSEGTDSNKTAQSIETAKDTKAALPDGTVAPSMPPAMTQAASPSQGTAQMPNFATPAAIQQWNDFLQLEKKSSPESKWEQLPENSRLFIGMAPRPFSRLMLTRNRQSPQRACLQERDI